MGPCNQPYTKFVEVGRVAYIAFGNDAGKICTIVDIIDQNRALIDGPCSGVLRQAISFNRLHLTKFSVDFKHSDKTSVVRKAWNDANINEKWAETKWAKRLESQKRRGMVTDFDRFKLKVTKQLRDRMIRRQLKILIHKKKLADRRAKKAERDKKLGKVPKERKPREPREKKKKPGKAPKSKKTGKARKSKKTRKARKSKKTRKAPKPKKTPKAPKEPKEQPEKQ